MFTKATIKQNGYQYLKDNVTIAYLCKNPLAADSLATIQSKSIADAAIAGTDVSFSPSGSDLLITINGKSGIDPSGTALATDDIQVVYCSATEVLASIDANDRDLTNEEGDTVDIPAAQVYVRDLTPVT
tara:strand:- start:186 stop:572 length:387 start_codon:yes stop_codon:yes gene_type:complete